MPPYSLTNFVIQKYQNEPGLNNVCSRNNIPKVNDGIYWINVDECKSVVT